MWPVLSFQHSEHIFDRVSSWRVGWHEDLVKPFCCNRISCVQWMMEFDVIHKQGTSRAQIQILYKFHKILFSAVMVHNMVSDNAMSWDSHNYGEFWTPKGFPGSDTQTCPNLTVSIFSMIPNQGFLFHLIKATLRPPACIDKDWRHIHYWTQ